MMSHFLVFERTKGHCSAYFIQAATVLEALRRYVIEVTGAEETPGGLTVWNHYPERSYPTTYTNPLECIECNDKAEIGWQIWEITPAHWQASFTELFCSEDPFEVREWIRLCEPEFTRKYPNVKPRGFVWYTIKGILVTFYRRTRRRIRQTEIVARYMITAPPFPPTFQEWSGSYDDLASILSISAPSAHWYDVIERSTEPAAHANAGS